MNPIQSYNQVYYVEVPKGVSANPIAIRPEIYADQVQWQDTSKGKVLKLGKVENLAGLTKSPPDSLVIISKEGQRYKLTKLTLDIYNEKVKKGLLAIHPLHPIKKCKRIT